MNKIIFVVITLLYSSLVIASDWKTGEWQIKVEGHIATITITKVDNSALTATIAWENDVKNALNGELFLFTEDTQQYARLVHANEKEITQLKLTSFGDIVYEHSLINQPDSATFAFLKPVTPRILKIDDYPTEQAIDDLQGTNTWLEYASNDLWKFWGLEEAAEYTTYRCNNGRLIDLTDICFELRQGWMLAEIDKDFTRMLSRQVYLYGVLFNMTGDPQALDFMEIGLDTLLERFDEQGSVSTVLKEGTPVYSQEQRTSQDLAYAQIGLAMGYYLSGDPLLLEKIDTLKDSIIQDYYLDDWGMLAWTLEDQLPGDSNNQELVAQLDQLNAYMLLVYPHLPTEMKPEWEKDIRLMVDILLEKFHDEPRNRFAGQVRNDKFNKPGERHNDFGHSVKTYWMIYTAGKLLSDESYVDIGRTGIDKIIKQAILFRTNVRGESNWANQVQSNGSSWWEFAELTQATATLALEQPDYVRYLPDIYRYWLNNFVDKSRGGVWSGANGGAKQFHWKNGYHEAELGLIALITSAQIKGNEVTLYFTKDTGHFQPYLYQVEPKSIHKNEFTEVTF